MRKEIRLAVVSMTTWRSIQRKTGSEVETEQKYRWLNWASTVTLGFSSFDPVRFMVVQKNGLD